jgi:protein phosphatase
VSADAVRREVARAETTTARDVPGRAAETRPRDVPDEDGEESEENGNGHTAGGRSERLTQVRSKVIDEGGVPATSPVAAGRRAPPGRSRRRRYIAGVLGVLALAAVVVGLYAGSRQFWFVGTDSRGQVALYRGLPYDLPLGIKLYSKAYQSAVPAAAISDARQRTYVLDHHPRSQGESVSLVRDIERKYARP